MASVPSPNSLGACDFWRELANPDQAFRDQDVRFISGAEAAAHALPTPEDLGRAERACAGADRLCAAFVEAGGPARIGGASRPM
ncbi:MAG: hypothetical protein H6729_01515 [Deltaproteobacteria bacterium]|nr:hypothetical protein [Deltaproteobacteria bacterium]